MHVLSFRSRLILFPCHKVLFSLMPFVSSLKVFPLCHLASFQDADNEMQFSGLLSTDSPDCCRRPQKHFPGCSRNAACVARGVRFIWSWHWQATVTSLVRKAVLLRTLNTGRGTENVPFLDKHPFSLQLQFGIRLKVSLFKVTVWHTVALGNCSTSSSSFYAAEENKDQCSALSSVTFIFLPVQGTIANSLTCVQLHKRAEKIAVMLMERGHLQDGDHVALVYPPGKEPCSAPWCSQKFFMSL